MGVTMPRKFSFDSRDPLEWIEAGAEWAIVEIPGAGTVVGLYLDDRVLSHDGKAFTHIKVGHVVRRVSKDEALAASRRV
jgi:hypothetical protein